MSHAPDTSKWIAPEDAAAIVAGRLGDPFRILGPQAHGRDSWVVAFDPGAERLSAVGARAHKLHPVPGAPGVFAGSVPKGAPYRLQGEGAGAWWDYDDPYRFGPVIGELDEYLLGEGTHLRLWQALGAHVMEHEGARGTHFAVWAPNASRVSVVGEFNGWDGRRHPMRPRGGTGVWELFLPGVETGAEYMYELLDAAGHLLPNKADPVGFGAQHPPERASVVRDLRGYGWSDDDWMETRAARQDRAAPIAIYEVHLGSWKRRMHEGGRPISYREAAEELVGYVAGMGFTHIELMPICEHPFEGSWGYQPVGLFAPSIRFGPPNEFRDLVDAAHRAGLGVLLDWVPGHFPSDPHGLARFDGTALYEHADPREGYHPDWDTLIYNHGRAEVANFLTANALYWLEEHHADGLRVDAVASMLYRDYSREAGEWVPNIHGGRENLESIALLRRVNTLVYGEVPGILTAAEESTAFPQVSQPVDAGGLGFGFKWNMGWMNDTLRYMQQDPVNRSHHHGNVTFGLSYAFSENYILPISHDEVVHGKGSMIAKMPGDEAEQFANLRAYYGFMWGHPGKKLLFMGCEFGQRAEWNHNATLDWAALERPANAGLQRLVADLNATYRALPALHAKDCEAAGFEWLEDAAADISVFAWIRRGGAEDAPVVVVCNFTPIERAGWRCGLPGPGPWREALNTDAAVYGGGNRGNMGRVAAEDVAHHGQAHSAKLTLPPLSVLYLVADA
ncbi:1,4-alpha-glucan branching enzyme [Rhodobacteraceae bacterium WD3A24]|nr:1,4-alpha-glucan branching enzyme [Rhodobacteraceae bacterium WD3A24]